MNHLFSHIFQDWEVNKQTSFKSRFILSLFRIAQFLSGLPYPLKFIVYLYQILSEILFSIELPFDTKVGPNLQLQHGFGLVINHQSTIGSNCILRHSTTIGNKILTDGSISASPVIGDYVEIGCNVVIIGPIQIGSHAVIGAGSVVISNVPDHAVVVGNPSRIIRFNNNRNRSDLPLVNSS